MSSGGGKVSYVLTLQHNSFALTYESMSSINMHVDEITMTRDNAFMYVYIHLQRKTRKDELEKALKDLSSVGVIGTNIFGYTEIDGTSRGLCESIENHPGFRTLVHHQAEGNTNFHRWTTEEFADMNSGYNKLKKQLLAKRTSATTGGGNGGRCEIEAKIDAEHKEMKATLNQKLIKTAQQDDQIQTLTAQLRETSRGEEEIKAKFAAENEEVCVCRECIPSYSRFLTLCSFIIMQIQTLTAQLSEASEKCREVEAKMDATVATLNQQIIFTAQQDDHIKTLVAQLGEALLVKERGEEEIKAKFAAEMEEVRVFFWKNSRFLTHSIF
jgi:hypothetical protein